MSLSLSHTLSLTRALWRLCSRRTGLVHYKDTVGKSDQVVDVFAAGNESNTRSTLTGTRALYRNKCASVRNIVRLQGTVRSVGT